MRSNRNLDGFLGVCVTSGTRKLKKDVPSSSPLSPLSPSVKRGCVVSEGRLTSFSTQTFLGLQLVPSLQYWPLIGCYQPPSSSGLRVSQDTTRLLAAGEGSVTGRLLIMDNTDYILWADTRGVIAHIMSPLSHHQETVHHVSGKRLDQRGNTQIDTFNHKKEEVGLVHMHYAQCPSQNPQTSSFHFVD